MSNSGDLLARQAEWLLEMVRNPATYGRLVTGAESQLPSRHEYVKGDLVEMVQPDGTSDMYRVAAVRPAAGGFGTTYDMEPARDGEHSR